MKFHQALRSILRAPGFAAFSVLVMALGIGLTTVAFFVLNAVLLQPLDLPQPEPGLAQTLFGSLVRNVKDASEAVVTGAAVTLTNLETAQSRKVTTTDAGSYDFPTIPPGTYELKIGREGFNPVLPQSPLTEG